MAGKISFFSKDEIECPVCQEKFQRESLLTGRGRLNAGELTDELRRIYIPTEKYGKVNPLLYPITTCPQCFYSTYPQDFMSVPEKALDPLKQDIANRLKFIRDLFDTCNFRTERGLKEGIASYLLSIYSYAFFPSRFAPSIKKALSAIRAAWLLSDLFNDSQNEMWESFQNLMYKRAFTLYVEAFDMMEKGRETVDTLKRFGPDLDKDYGYDGFLYLYVYLFYNYGLEEISDKQEKLQKIDKFKIIVSKVFGIGKSSRDKTVFLLDKARAMYDKLTDLQKSIAENE